MAQWNSAFQAKLAIVAVQVHDQSKDSIFIKNSRNKNQINKRSKVARFTGIQNIQTLNREPMDENFDVLEDSSGSGGNKPDTNEHLDAVRRA